MVFHVFYFVHKTDQFQSTYPITERVTFLCAEDDARMFNALSCKIYEIAISCDQRTPLLSGTGEVLFVTLAFCFNLLNMNGVNTTQS